MVLVSGGSSVSDSMPVWIVVPRSTYNVIAQRVGAGEGWEEDRGCSQLLVWGV